MDPSIRIKLIQLHHCRGVGWKTLNRMLQHDPTLNKIFAYSPKDFTLHLQIPRKKAELIVADLQTVQQKNLIQQYKERNIQIITIFDAHYPFLLKQIYQPPFVLYCLGNARIIESKRMLSVVGTRKPTEYGRIVTERLIKDLVKHNYVIVSGFAKGIDGIAHENTDRYGGQTIAVLGSGFFHIYPKEHHSLFQILSKNHLIISEYPPNKRPEKHHFPERNRIIAGLSLGTVVMEAKERSGSLITADFALQEGREVFAVPGPVTAPTSIGTNGLIQQGAKLVQSIDDIISEIKNMEGRL